MVDRILKPSHTSGSELMLGDSPMGITRVIKSLEESIQTDDLDEFLRYYTTDVVPLRRHLGPCIIYEAKGIFEYIVENLKVKTVVFTKEEHALNM